eukprot:g2149.t1
MKDVKNMHGIPDVSSINSSLPRENESALGGSQTQSTDFDGDIQENNESKIDKSVPNSPLRDSLAFPFGKHIKKDEDRLQSSNDEEKEHLESNETAVSKEEEEFESNRFDPFRAQFRPSNDVDDDDDDEYDFPEDKFEEDVLVDDEKEDVETKEKVAKRKQQYSGPSILLDRMDLGGDEDSMIETGSYRGSLYETADLSERADSLATSTLDEFGEANQTQITDESDVVQFRDEDFNEDEQLNTELPLSESAGSASNNDDRRFGELRAEGEVDAGPSSSSLPVNKRLAEIRNIGDLRESKDLGEPDESIFESAEGTLASRAIREPSLDDVDNNDEECLDEANDIERISFEGSFSDSRNFDSGLDTSLASASKERQLQEAERLVESTMESVDSNMNDDDDGSMIDSGESFVDDSESRENEGKRDESKEKESVPQRRKSKRGQKDSKREDNDDFTRSRVEEKSKDVEKLHDSFGDTIGVKLPENGDDDERRGISQSQKSDKMSHTMDESDDGRSTFSSRESHSSKRSHKEKGNRRRKRAVQDFDEKHNDGKEAGEKIVSSRSPRSLSPKFSGVGRNEDLSPIHGIGRKVLSRGSFGSSGGNKNLQAAAEAAAAAVNSLLGSPDGIPTTEIRSSSEVRNFDNFDNADVKRRVGGVDGNENTSGNLDTSGNSDLIKNKKKKKKKKKKLKAPKVPGILRNKHSPKHVLWGDESETSLLSESMGSMSSSALHLQQQQKSSGKGVEKVGSDGKIKSRKSRVAEMVERLDVAEMKGSREYAALAATTLPEAGTIKSWNVRKILKWLAEIGLQELVTPFRDLELNGEDLLEISEEDLADHLPIHDVSKRAAFLRLISHLQRANETQVQSQPAPTPSSLAGQTGVQLASVRSAFGRGGRGFDLGESAPAGSPSFSVSFSQTSAVTPNKSPSISNSMVTVESKANNLKRKDGESNISSVSTGVQNRDNFAEDEKDGSIVMRKNSSALPTVKSRKSNKYSPKESLSPTSRNQELDVLDEAARRSPPLSPSSRSPSAERESRFSTRRPSTVSVTLPPTRKMGKNRKHGSVSPKSKLSRKTFEKNSSRLASSFGDDSSDVYSSVGEHDPASPLSNLGEDGTKKKVEGALNEEGFDSEERNVESKHRHYRDRNRKKKMSPTQMKNEVMSKGPNTINHLGEGSRLRREARMMLSDSGGDRSGGGGGGGGGGDMEILDSSFEQSIIGDSGEWESSIGGRDGERKIAGKEKDELDNHSLTKGEEKSPRLKSSQSPRSSLGGKSRFPLRNARHGVKLDPMSGSAGAIVDSVDSVASLEDSLASSWDAESGSVTASLEGSLGHSQSHDFFSSESNSQSFGVSRGSPMNSSSPRKALSAGLSPLRKLRTLPLSMEDGRAEGVAEDKNRKEKSKKVKGKRRSRFRDEDGGNVKNQKKKDRKKKKSKPKSLLDSPSHQSFLLAMSPAPTTTLSPSQLEPSPSPIALTESKHSEETKNSK